MDGRKVQFLKAVLGEDGATALQKAAVRSEVLGNLLIPRTVIAWLGFAARSEYRGQIPGISNTYISFKKNEDGFNGEISVSDEIYSFEKASLYHVAASIAVSLGADKDKAPSAVKDIDLTRLGKSIDLLVKARAVTKELLNKKAEPPKKIHRPEPQIRIEPSKKSSKPSLPRIVANKQLPTLKLSEHQLDSRCPVCACSQMNSGKFVGCMCFRALSKNVKVVRNEDKTLQFTFGNNWDRESVEVFLQSLGGSTN